MAVRKTEKQLPQGFTADRLGQNAVSTSNANVILISFLTSPLAVRNIQNYVVFVTDSALHSTVNSYEWIFTNGASVTINTTIGAAEYTPQNTGNLSVTVNLKDSADAVLATVSLTQQVTALNLELEQLIDQEGTSSPSAGNPGVSREVINDLRKYADAAASPVSENALNRLLLSLVYSRLSANSLAQRTAQLDSCITAFENNTPDNFFGLAQTGIGITKVRPHVAAMFLADGASPYIPVVEYPASATHTQQVSTVATITASFNSLTEQRRIDIFNLLRFPESNIAVCKLILDGLTNRYFSGIDYRTVLGSRNNGRRLITEYERGPYIPPTGASVYTDVSASSNTIFNLLMMPVWRIIASGSTTPVNTIDPATRLFGVPEYIPEKCFIADTGIFPGDADFIQSSRSYHTNFNIQYTTIRSVEGIINALQASTTAINHLRLFTHANNDLLGLPLFDGGSGWTTSRHVDGFVTSEIDGVIGIIKAHFSGQTFIWNWDMSHHFLYLLRTNNPEVLRPFGLDSASSPPTPDMVLLLRRYIDIWLVNIPGTIRIGTAPSTYRDLYTTHTGAHDNERDEIVIPFFNLITTDLETGISASMPTLTPAHFTALRTALLGLTPADVGFQIPPQYPFSFNYDTNYNRINDYFLRDFKSTLRALADHFMTKLNYVRNTIFDSSSVIDIRGCKVGELPFGSPPPPPFLVSLQQFFGRSGNYPNVNGPEWYQTFVLWDRNQPLADNNAIDTAFNSGFVFPEFTVSDADVVSAFDEWKNLTNLNDQFSFFNTLFSTTSLFDFFLLQWRSWRTAGSSSGIPALNIYSRKVDDIVQLAPGDLLNRLIGNFSASAPALSADSIARLALLQPLCVTYKNITVRVSGSSSPTPSDLNQFFQDLSNVVTQILAVSGMPAPSSPLMPATAPSGLDLPAINGYIIAITAYITAFLTSEIGALYTALQTAIALPDAMRHYYFTIELPLLVQNSNPLAVNIDRIEYVVFYKSGFAEGAVKGFMKCQWQGTPSQLLDMHNFIDGLTITDGNAVNRIRVVALVSDERDIRIGSAICPLPAFASHIRST